MPSKNHNPGLPRIFLDPTSPQSPSPLLPPPSPFLTRVGSSSPISHQQQSSPNATASSKFHPLFLPTLRHLNTQLCPLVSATTGRPHPSFPTSVLAYHLLTSSQLDELARHYHQVWPPVAATWDYPMAIPAWLGTRDETTVDLPTKRRRFGRFIGLRGCESPVEMHMQPDGMEWQGPAQEQGLQGDDVAMETEEEMLRRMEVEWMEALRRAREEDSDVVLRWKAGGY